MSKLEPQASKGASNATYLYCERMGHRRKYFICLHTIAAYERGDAKPQTQTEECGHAVDCGACLAKKMHSEEIAKGEAIYFEEDPFHKAKKPEEKKEWTYGTARKIVTGFDNKSPVSKVERPTGVSSLKTTRPVPKKEEPMFDSMDMSKLVTDMAKEETKNEQKAKAVVETAKPVITATPKPTTPTATRLPGESLLDMAKRLRKEKQL